MSKNFSKAPAILSPFIANRMFGWEPLNITKKMNLRDFEKGHAYPICSSIECHECDLLFLDLRFHSDDLDRYYSGYQTEEFFQQRERFEESFAKRRTKSFKSGSGIVSGYFCKLPEVERFISSSNFIPKSILDYGGGDGTGTPFNKISEVLHIFDVDTKNLKYGNPVDIKAIYKNNYDLILVRNVIEHVSYPDKILETINKICLNKTLVYIEVPREKFLDQYPPRKRARNKIIWHEHINFYEEKSLRALVKRMG
ncbi:uncharacterized protein METZ01_LOCUS217345, partial [marine metagenome]